MITLYNEKGEVVKHISAFEFNDADMGESSISATISFKEEQNFHPDWYVVYNGEKFRLGVRKPTGKKDTSSLSTSYTLVFKSEREDLKRYTFMDFVELGTGNPQPNSYKVPLYATLSEFVHRFNVNLTYYMGQRWKMVLPVDYVESGNAVSAVFDNMSLWNVLLKVYEIWGVRWKVVPEDDVLNIQVGFTADEIEHVFEYGKDNGLVSVERNNALERIITRLRGRGGQKNLPLDYFHQGDPDTNSFLQATFFQNLMPKAYRDYIRGYNAGSGEGSWAYNKGVADRVSGADIAPVDYVISDKEDLWGISYGSIEPNEEIYPTLQGAKRNGSRLDTVIAVEQVLADSPGIESDRTTNIRDDIKMTSQGVSLSGGNELYPSCEEPILVSPIIDPLIISKPYNTVTLKFKLDSLYKIYPNVDNVFPAFLGQDVVLEGSIELYNTDSAVVVAKADIYNTDEAEIRVDNIVEGIYAFRINLQWYGINQSAGTIISCNFSFYDINTEQYTSAATKEGYKPTFDIWIKDVWNIPRETGETDEDYTYRVWGPLAVSEEMTVMFSDGLLAGEDYEFRLAGVSIDANSLRSVIVSAIHPDNSMSLGSERSAWRLTLQKSEAEVEASGRYLPNSMQNAKAGDHFFFVNIAMPYDPYVYDAEARVNAYLDEQLALKDEEFPSFTIAPSSIFCKDFAEVDKLKAGSIIRVRNLELIGDAYLPLHIQSVTKRYSDNKFNPDWTITVSDQIVASGNPVETLKGDVDVLASQVYSNKEAVSQAIRQLSTTFLRKDGVKDTSYSPYILKENVEVGGNVVDEDFSRGDVNGKGFGVYTDGDGNRVVEADILIGRIGARFNEVHLNQTTYSGGKQIFSAAGLQILRVEEIDGGWRCFFDNKNGSVRNLFVIGDGAYCQHFTLVGYTTYWRRVIGIGADYIDLSSTDCLEGSSIPMVGDEVAQLGNNADRSRQAALVIDVVRDGGGLVTWYDDITDFTLSDNDSVNIGRMETDVQLEDGTVEKVWKTWLQVYGSAYIGDKEQKQYLQFDNGKLKVKGALEVGSKISDAMTVVEDGIIQSTLLKLGYYEEGLFKVMSGTNGLYDSSAKGGGIAAWYGGPMIDKEANEEVSEFAEALFRFDGSGYLAGGNISWDKEGAGKVAGGDIFWDKDGNITLGVGIKISGDAEETLGSILTTVNKLLSWFGEDENEDIYVKKKSDGTPRNFYSFGEVSSGGIGGNGESGEDSGTGITSLYDIPEIAVDVDTLADGQSLVYDAVSGKWVNRLVQGGSGSGVNMDYVWAALAGATEEKINASHIPDLSDVYLPLTGGYMHGNIAFDTGAGIMASNSSSNIQIGMYQNNGIFLQGPRLLYSPASGSDYKIWHEGNDGSGSGLDADLLDGLHASDFTKKFNVTIWGQSFDGTADVTNSLYIPNNSMILFKDTAGTNINAFHFTKGNQMVFGSDTHAKKYSTFIGGYDIRFRYGESAETAMFIKSDGNVGIGTLSPGYKLEVNGTTHLNGKVTLTRDVVLNNYTAIKFKDSNGAELNTIMVGTDNALTIGVDHSVKNYETRIKGVGVTLFHGGTQVLSLTSTELITAKGITPFVGNTYDLGSSSNRWQDIYCYNLDAATRIIMQVPGFTYPCAKIIRDTSTNKVYYQAGLVDGSARQGKMGISGIDATKLASLDINSTLTTISDKLFVAGDIALGKNIVLNNSCSIKSYIADGSTDYDLLYLSTGNNFQIGYGTAIVGKFKTNLHGYGIDFRSKGTDGATMSLTTDGNVGIGTTTPAYKLDVIGAIRTDSFISFGSTGALVTTDVMDNFREAVFGDTISSSRLRTFRATSAAGLPYLPAYAASLAWASADTHAFVSVDYTNNKSIYFGAGNANSLVWTAKIFHNKVSLYIDKELDNKLQIGSPNARWSALYAYAGNFVNGVRTNYFYNQDVTRLIFQATTDWMAIGGSYRANECRVVLEGRPLIFQASDTTDLTIGADGIAIFSKMSRHDAGIKIGEATLVWDSGNQCLVVDKDFAGLGEISSGGIGAIIGAGGGTLDGNLDITGQLSVAGATTLNGLLTLKSGMMSKSMVIGSKIQNIEGEFGACSIDLYGTLYINNPDTGKWALLKIDSESEETLAVLSSSLSVVSLVQTSDIRYKQIIEDVCLSSEVIANAPIFKFTWKNSDAKVVHIGTSAQYWLDYAPELTALYDDRYSLDYATLAVLMGKSNASEIKQLKLRVKELENEVMRLKGGNYDNI